MSHKFGPVKTKKVNKTQKAEEVPEIYKIHKALSQDQIGSLTFVGGGKTLKLVKLSGNSRDMAPISAHPWSNELFDNAAAFELSIPRERPQSYTF